MRFLTLALVSLAVSVRAEAAVPDSSVTGTVETVVKSADREVVKADTLWALAKHFYNDPWQWTRIYDANKDQIKDPHWIYPNQVLIIPGFDRSVRVVKTTSKEEARPAKPLPVEEIPLSTPPPSPVAAPAPEYRPDRFPGSIPVPESLSTRLPEGMTASEPSVYRMLMPKGWNPKAKVVAYGGREAIAAEGDEVQFELNDSDVKVRKGTRFTVWRRSAPTEADSDQNAVYAQKIGLIEATKRVATRRFRAVVLHSGGPVTVDDLLTMGE